MTKSSKPNLALNNSLNTSICTLVDPSSPQQSEAISTKLLLYYQYWDLSSRPLGSGGSLTNGDKNINNANPENVLLKIMLKALVTSL